MTDMPARELISTPQTWYVDGLNGSDSNDGLTTSAAFATIQGGADKMAALYDFAAVPTLRVLPTIEYYSESVNLGRWVGSAPHFRILGDPADNAAVAVYPDAGGPAIKVVGGRGSPYLIESILVQSSGDYGIISDAGSHVLLKNPHFSWVGLAHMFAEHTGFMEVLAGSYTVSGGALWHIAAVANGEFIHQNNTIVFQNNPVFNLGFALAAYQGLVFCKNLTGYSGARQIAVKTCNDPTYPGMIIPPASGVWP